MIMQLLQALQQMQGGAGGGMGSLPFPRPGMTMGQDQGAMNQGMMSALGSNPWAMMGGGGMSPMGGGGIGTGRMPVMPRTGGTSPIHSLVRNHFANQPASPSTQPQMGGGGGMPGASPLRTSLMNAFQNRMPSTPRY